MFGIVTSPRLGMRALEDVGGDAEISHGVVQDRCGRRAASMLDEAPAGRQASVGRMRVRTVIAGRMPAGPDAPMFDFGRKKAPAAGDAGRDATEGATPPGGVRGLFSRLRA